jgi:two-component system response regulator
MTPPASILLAEDNSADVELILESLSEVQPVRHIHVVRDGVAALDFLFSRGESAERPLGSAPRLILLDLKLPRVDGLEVLARIKQDPHTRCIPTVMLSSSNVARDVAEAYRLGVNSYLQKPMDFLRFREVVRDAGRYWLTMNEAPPVVASARLAP